MIVCAALLAVGVISAGAVGALVLLTQRETHTLRGTISVPSAIRTTFGDDCVPMGGYGDMARGAHVKVTDGEGKVIGASMLGAPRRPSSNADDTYLGNSLETGRCIVSFTVDDLPRTDFYTITVGDRSGGSYSHSQLGAADWSISLTVG